MVKGAKRSFNDATSGSDESIECVSIGLPATLVIQRLDVHGYDSEDEALQGESSSVYRVANKITNEKVYYPDVGLLRFYVADDDSDVFVPANQIEYFEAAIGWKLS